MNKIKIKKETKTETIIKEIDSTKFGKFLCTETYINGKLNDQFFHLKKPIQRGYEPKKMKFYYFGGIIDFNKIKESYTYESYNFPKEILINDLALFNDFENLYCIWFGMDDNIYRITDIEAVPTIYHEELWGIDFDLEKAKRYLEKQKTIFDVKIENSIYQNYSITGKQTLVFTYLLPKKIFNKIYNLDTFKRKNMIIKYYKLDKFKIK